MSVLANHRVLKAITTEAIVGEGKGGRLNPQQARQFITAMVDETDFLREIRFVDMDGPEYDLDYMEISQRLIRRGVEAEEPTGGVQVQTARRKLQTIEAILPVDISLTFLEDNIERDQAEDTIARMVATQYGNDLLDLAINGDTEYTGGVDQEFLTIDDGWIKKAKSAKYATHKVDITGAEKLLDEILPALVDALPAKWKRDRNALRIICSTNTVSRYIRELQARNTTLGDTMIVTGQAPRYEGIALRPVTYWPDDVLMLTMPRNLAMGVQRNFRIDREYKPRKRLVEYTLTNRFDPAEIVIDDAVAIAYKAS